MSRQAGDNRILRPVFSFPRRNGPPRALMASLALITAFMLGGCSSPRTHFYSLTKSLPQPAQQARQPDFLIAVQPVDIPPAVNRPQLLVRTSPQQVVPMEFRRWAAPLSNEIRNGLAENLEKKLATQDVYAAPKPQNEPIYRIRVHVDRFESIVNHFAFIRAAWSIQPPQKKASPVTCFSRIKVDTKGGYNGLIASHQKALARMAGSIADTLRGMRAEHSQPQCPVADEP